MHCAQILSAISLFILVLFLLFSSLIEEIDKVVCKENLGVGVVYVGIYSRIVSPLSSKMVKSQFLIDCERKQSVIFHHPSFRTMMSNCYIEKGPSSISLFLLSSNPFCLFFTINCVLLSECQLTACQPHSLQRERWGQSCDGLKPGHVE